MPTPRNTRSTRTSSGSRSGISSGNTRGTVKTSKVTTISARSVRPYTALTVGALIAAIVGCILVSILVDATYMYVPNLVIVPIAMMILALPIILVCGIIEAQKLGLSTSSNALGMSRVVAFTLAGTLLMGAATCALEFIYELGYAYTGVNYTDYIFVIDDSGSMSGSDPQNKRYTALESLLGNMDQDNMIGVIRFASNVESEIEPALMDDTHRQNVQNIIDAPAVSGGTDIQVALERAAEMFAQYKRSGEPSAIILLSDGVSYVDVDALANTMNAMDVDICTVALGRGTDRKVLQNLADATGGIMLDVSDADMLHISYKLLNGGSIRRSLLMPRLGSDKSNLLAGAMSILFMGILGTLISAILVFMFNSHYAKPQLVVGAVASFAGAIVHELGNNMGIGGLGRTVMLILFGLVLLQARSHNSTQTIEQNTTSGRRARTGTSANATTYDLGSGESKDIRSNVESSTYRTRRR